MFFAQEFQTRLLKVLWDDTYILSEVQEYLKAEMFDDEIHRLVYNILLDYIQKYDAPPTKMAIQTELEEKLKLLDKETRSVLITVFFEEFLEDVEEKEYIKNKIREWARKQIFKKSVLEASQSIEIENLDKAEEAFVEALSFRPNTSLGIRYFEDLELRTKERLYTDRIPTLIPPLDRLLNGGVGRRELCIWMAPPKQGKSMALLHVARAAVLQRFKTVYYSLELLDENAMKRIDAGFTGTPTNILMSEDYPKITLQRLERLAAKRHNTLMIKEFPTRGASVQDLEAHVRRLKVIGFIPDLIIVDYGDIMRSSGKYFDKRHAISEIFEDLRGLGGKLNIPIHTATQTNREAVGKEIITMKNIAEDFSKVMTADIILAICQTPQESQENRRRIFIAANRNNIQEIEIPFKSDFTRGLFYQND